MSAPAPAPLTYTPWPYTPSGKAEAWVRGYVFTDKREDYAGNMELCGHKQTCAVMREEARR